MALLPFRLADLYHQDPDVFLAKPMTVLLDLVAGTVAMREKQAKQAKRDGRTSRP